MRPLRPAQCRLVPIAAGVQAGSCGIAEIDIFYAYADPAAGEYGAVYQACELGLSRARELKNGRQRRGADHGLASSGGPERSHEVAPARVLREPRQGRRLTLAEACEQGWRIGCREAKHLYAINLGRDRRRWLKSIVARRNPAPRPDLKGGRTMSGTDKDKAQRLHDKLGEALA